MSRTRFQLLLRDILNAPLLTWVLLGFSLSYLLFFIRPIFFMDVVMNIFTYIPTISPIGTDLREMLGLSTSLFTTAQTPYIANYYPPLASVIFAPLLVVSASWAYKIFTLVSVACYAVITFVFPLRTSKERQVSSILILVFVTGLFSYGFQFELERGQWNVIAVFMSFLAIWIYHFHNKYRFLAYVFFTISVQLKVFPLIFIVMLISNWHDWKNNIKRFLLLATVNFALLFVLGPNVFVGWLKTLTTGTANPTNFWIGNHSISSFVTMTSDYWEWVKPYSGLAQIALLALIAVCIFLIILQEYRQEQKGMNPHLLLACTLGALLIPSISHDYKLSLLAAPVAILFSDHRFWERVKSPRMQMILIALLTVFSAAYSSTLFSFTNKPLILKNNFPALVTMLIIITVLSLVSKPRLEGKEFEPIETALNRHAGN